MTRSHWEEPRAAGLSALCTGMEGAAGRSPAGTEHANTAQLSGRWEAELPSGSCLVLRWGFASSSCFLWCTDGTFWG